MSEPEGFLSRWTRLKHEAGEAPQPAAPQEPAREPAPDPARAAPALEGVEPSAPARAQEAAVDLSALPSIESITATTDIRAFLAPGVPADLTRAALRRAWVADPKIRDFVGIAENQWDFTAPDAMPGFGPLGPLDDVRRLVARAMGEEPDTPAAPALADAENSPDSAPGGKSIAPASSESNATSDETVALADEPLALAVAAAGDVQRSETNSAPHKDDVDRVALAEPTRRTHGGALPK
jgi:hypothetical protein